jgi:hypothetical protein
VARSVVVKEALTVKGKGTAACGAHGSGRARRCAAATLPVGPGHGLGQPKGLRSDVDAAERIARITASGGESLVR